MIDTNNQYDKDIAKTVSYLCQADKDLMDIGTPFHHFRLLYQARENGNVSMETTTAAHWPSIQS